MGAVTDVTERLISALSEQYAIERELGAADHADVGRHTQMKLDD
jgi:hypothetical protein